MESEGQRRPIIALDFDGVVHSYTSAYKYPEIIPDPPVNGAIEFIEMAFKEGYEVVIFSCRAITDFSIRAMKQWLVKHGLSKELVDYMIVTDRKPPCDIYIDDNGYRFEGVFPSFNEIRGLKPWNKG